MIKLNLAARDYVVREILATIKDDEGGVSFEAPSPHAEYINAILKRIREGCGLTKEDLEHE